MPNLVQHPHHSPIGEGGRVFYENSQIPKRVRNDTSRPTQAEGKNVMPNLVRHLHRSPVGEGDRVFLRKLADSDLRRNDTGRPPQAGGTRSC